MSVLEIEKNKKYRIEVVIGYNGTHKIRHTETFYGGKREAILKENQIKLQIQSNNYIKKNISMHELVDEWLLSKKEVVGRKTFVEYTRYCNNIKNCLGHIKIKNINTKILEDFYNELRHHKGKREAQNGYAEKTIKHHYTLITEIFNSAIKWGYITTNPNKNVAPIKVHKKEVECYSVEEVQKLMNVLPNEPIKNQAIIILALDTGCRRGEITGLTWDDIDFKNGTISINKATQYVAGYGTFEKSTKTNTSNRTLYLAPITIKKLKQYKNSQDKRKLSLGSKWLGSQRVFTTDFGEDMHPDRPYKILKHVIKKYDLKDISFHGLRHTSISLQILSGVQVQIISRRAGHSSVTITHDIYSHFFDNEFKEVANKMNNILDVNAV